MSEVIFEKILLELYKDDLFTEREILIIKEAVEKLSTDYTSKYFEIEKSEVLKKLASLSFAIEIQRKRAMSEDKEKLILEKIDKRMQKAVYDPTNWQFNEMLKILRERLSVFIPKDTFMKNEEYMYIIIKELYSMGQRFREENKEEVSDE